MDGKSCARLLVIAEFTRIHAAIDTRTRVQVISQARGDVQIRSVCGATETEHAQLSARDFYLSRSKKGRKERFTLGPAGSLRDRWSSPPASCAMWACVAVHSPR
jgi:hypothetical protein